MTFDAVLSNAVNVTILIAAVAAGYVSLKKWIRKTVAEPLGKTKDQLLPNGGESVHDMVKAAAEDSKTALTKLDDLTKMAVANRDVANAGLALAKNVDERLDRHMKLGH